MNDGSGSFAGGVVRVTEAIMPTSESLTMLRMSGLRFSVGMGRPRVYSSIEMNEE
jgi:hypothetical protein